MPETPDTTDTPDTLERPAGSARGATPHDDLWLLRLFASSRFFVGIAIIGAFIGGVIVLLYATLMVFQVGWESLSSSERSVEGLEILAVQFVGLLDVFLLGIVLYLIAVGFYQLFINPNLPVPAWLRIDDLDDLKAKLVAVIIVMLGVNFLGVIELDEHASVLEAGIAVALVVTSLAIVLFVYERRREG